MDLAELRALIAVVDLGSYQGAARALGVSRTTLRRQVASLEARAGVPLLEAGRQGVVPTEAGRLLARQGATMMQEAGALLASIRECGQEPSGTLRVCMPVGLPPQVLAPLVAALRSQHPRLSFEVRFSDDPLGEARSDIDLAVHFGVDPPRGNWISHVVMGVREWLLASPSYLERRGTPRTVEELRGHDLLVWSPPGEDARVWRTSAGMSFSVEPVLVATDIHFVRHCCLAGVGIGRLPDALVPDPGVPEGSLVPVMSETVRHERALRVSVPAALAEIPKLKMVVELARRFAREI
ncbi:MAG: LysR family transcriptional regulator [Myxococcales bacterium]|nr:LysR family transcriptional regulator [Myxococcales bacterium]